MIKGIVKKWFGFDKEIMELDNKLAVLSVSNTRKSRQIRTLETEVEEYRKVILKVADKYSNVEDEIHRLRSENVKLKVRNTFLETKTV